MKKKFALDRRMLLKGAGVSLALPMLEAMIPKSVMAQSVEKPIIINCMWPNGLPAVNDNSEKKTSGLNKYDEQWQVACQSEYAVNHYLNRLSPLARSMSSVVPNSSHEWDGSFTGHESMCGIFAGNGGGGRYANFGQFLSAGGNPNLLMSESYDQRIARHFGLKSINAIGAKGYYGSPYSNEAQGRRICDPISWKRNINSNGQFDGTHRPVDLYEQPYDIYDEIVGKQNETGNDAEKLARRQLLMNKDTILSKIMGSINDLNKNLGSSDKKILEEYLQGVRDIDTKVAAELEVIDGAPSSQTCSSSLGRPGYFQEDWTHETMERKVRLIQDLYTLAMECDLYQVFGLTHAGRAAGLSMYGQGGAMSWHSVSHWRFTDGGSAVVASASSQDAQRKRYAEFALKQITLFADWMNRLAEKKQANGKSILEKVSATLSTDISDGNNHSRHGIPVFMAGIANGKIPKHNGHQFNIDRHCTYLENNTWWHGFHKAEIWLAILQQLGVPESSFGISSNALPGFNQPHS